MRPITYEARPKLSDVVYQVIEQKLLTPNVAQVFLAPREGAPLIYQAGQYIKIVHPDQSTSPFSIANAPDSGKLLEFHLLFLKENRKAWDIFQHLRDKKDVRLSGPYGRCTAACLDEKKPVIFIARSTGFSPIKAVIEEWIRKPAYPPMHLYWSVPGWRDLYLAERIHAWVKDLRHFHFTAVLTREILPPEAGAKYGPIPDLVLQDYPDLSGHQVYVSGPEKMVYAALEAFQQKGLPRDSFYSDVFDYSS